MHRWRWWQWSPASSAVKTLTSRRITYANVDTIIEITQTVVNKAILTSRDVTEPEKIRIGRMRISCAKSVKCGFVARSKLVPANTATAIQLSYLKLNSYEQTSSE